MHVLAVIVLVSWASALATSYTSPVKRPPTTLAVTALTSSVGLAIWVLA